jgi:hypothetical protein
VIPGFKLPGPLQCDFAQVVPHGITGPVEVLFVLLAAVDYEVALVRDLIEGIRLTIGKKVRLKHRPSNDYLGFPYFGQYPELKGLALAIRDCVRSENIHWDSPETWSFKFIILTGRRSHTPQEQRKALMNRSGFRLDIASYDRLLDDRNSLYP